MGLPRVPPVLLQAIIIMLTRVTVVWLTDSINTLVNDTSSLQRWTPIAVPGNSSYFMYVDHLACPWNSSSAIVGGLTFVVQTALTGFFDDDKSKSQPCDWVGQYSS